MHSFQVVPRYFNDSVRWIFIKDRINTLFRNVFNKINIFSFHSKIPGMFKAITVCVNVVVSLFLQWMELYSESPVVTTLKKFHESSLLPLWCRIDVRSASFSELESENPQCFVGHIRCLWCKWQLISKKN